MPFEIKYGDIIDISADAIVNAANAALLPGGGVCGAIFRAAGDRQLDQACREIGHCDTGSAVWTPGFHLNASYIIHTVGPIWQGGERGEAELLKSCYRSSMALAIEKGCQSIAFPLISAGIYGYPQDQALEIAQEAIWEFLCEHELTVYLVLYDRTIQVKLPITVVAGYIRQEGKVFLCRRPMHKARGGQWEFPGGKVEPGENPAKALARELREELSITVKVGRLCAQTVYAYPELRIRLLLLSAEIIEGKPTLLEHTEFKWVTEAKTLNLCPADRLLVEELERRSNGISE